MVVLNKVRGRKVFLSNIINLTACWQNVQSAMIALEMSLNNLCQVEKSPEYMW